MLIQSLWTKEVPKLTVPTPKKLEDVDLLIVGAGITGLTCAYFLRNQKEKIMLVDKGSFGMGVTSHTTGKLNYLQETIYQKLEKNYNIHTSQLYFQSQKEAIQLVKQIVKENHIDCHLEEVDSFLYTNEEKNLPKLEKEKNLLQGWDVKVREVDFLPLKQIPVKKGIVVSDTYVFHPLKYLNGLLKAILGKVLCYEGVMVENLVLQENKTYVVQTSKGTFRAKKVILACHYPFFVKPRLFPISNYIKREFVQVARIPGSYHFTSINIDQNLESIRFYQDYLIYGSNEQKLMDSTNYQEGYEKSRKEFVSYFQKEPEFSWMNQDLVMNDSLPWIGLMDKKQPNLLVGAGYQAWGMTGGTIAGKVLSDLVLHADSPYQNLFSPLRFMKPSLLPILSNGWEFAKAYSTTYFRKNPTFYRSNVMFLKLNGVDCGVYIDSDGKRHIVKNLCPHMLCKLVFNEKEKTWDCPCHGSRFTIDGDVLEGPSTYSIRIR